MPDLPRAALLPAVNVRLSETQRAYVLLHAEHWHCSISEAIRRMIDDHLDGAPRVRTEDEIDSPDPDAGLPLRSLLERAEDFTPDPEWFARYGEGE